jgi:hypothetical protein
VRKAADRQISVEDFGTELMVASLLQEILETAGCIVAGPIPRVAEVDAADRDTYDAAILDINFAGYRSCRCTVSAQRAVCLCYRLQYRGVARRIRRPATPL